MKTMKKFIIEIFGFSPYPSAIKWLMFPFVLFTVFFRRLIQCNDISKMDLVITTKCSLKCKNCSNLMQHYGKDTLMAADYSTEELYADIHKLLTLADRIWQLVVVGGEPLMNRNLPQILTHLVAHTKIKIINVVTNGTIIPSDELLKVLQNRKIQVTVSDYGHVAKNKGKVLAALQQNDIRYKLLEAMVWVDRGEIRQRGRSPQELAALFDACISKCTSLMNGKLYHCEVYPNGVNLGFIEELDDEVIDIRNISKRDFSAAFKKFNERKYIHTCDYCGEVTYGENNTVKAGIQLAKAEE